MSSAARLLPMLDGVKVFSDHAPKTAHMAPQHIGRSQELGQPVTLKGVARAFGSRRVLTGIDLEVPAGQFVAIVGRSGGGKTTLMRLIVGLDAPSAGEICIGERPVTGLQADVRLLFQDARLLPWQSVIGNVGIARGPGWREVAARTLADVGLAGRENDWPAILSGGQRQRVALARALVSEPAVLLLDEPFGALDALTRIDMHQLLERIWEQHRFTAFLITHDVSEAVALADRVLVLREGELVLDMPIDLPRPRRIHGDPEIGRYQAGILNTV
jgi:sulfonate transport system ATP-binding protein